MQGAARLPQNRQRAFATGRVRACVRVVCVDECVRCVRACARACGPAARARALGALVPPCFTTTTTTVC